jgi:excisionase family DNA binding protein
MTKEIYLTTKQASKILGVSVSKVKELIASRQLDARKEKAPGGYKWLIIKDSAIKYKENLATIGDNSRQQATDQAPAGDRSGASSRQQSPTGDSSRQTDSKSDKEMIEFLKNQLQKKDDQLDQKDNIIQQQNSIIMATQKNMNDLLQQHNELKYTATKKEDLIKQLEYDRKKTESSVKAIAKLERMIDDALMEKRLRDGIEFSKQLMKDRKK